jgi:hypothetical protein
MVTQTKYLHDYFEKTKHYIAIESMGEGIYMLVDKNDKMFDFDSVSGTITDTGKELNDYLYDRLSNV